MSKLDHLQQKQLNPADKLRAMLRGLEESHVKIKSMDSTAGLALLQNLDQIQLLFEKLGSTDLNLEPEQGRYHSIQARLRHSAGPLLNGLGGAAVLKKNRPAPAPPPERWWWYIDELVAAHKRSRWRQIVIAAAVVLVIVGGLVLAFNTVLAPSPEVAARIDAENAAFLAIEAENYEAALDAVGAGLAQIPDDPGLLILQGVLLELLGQQSEAAQALGRADTLLDDDLSYYLTRAQLELRTNQPEKAEPDIRTALELSPNSPSAWLLLGQALEFQRDSAGAAAAYRQASELALQSGDNQVAVLARLALARLGGLGDN